MTTTNQQANPYAYTTSSTLPTSPSPDDSADVLADALHAAKMRVAQIKGWHAFAKLRDGVKAVKPARKARKTPNGAGDASAELATFTDSENGAPQA